MSEFYMVSFEMNGDFYFFKEQENAFAFMLENFCNDNPDATNSEIGAANEELAVQSGISDYGWIDKVYFEDD